MLSLILLRTLLPSCHLWLCMMVVADRVLCVNCKSVTCSGRLALQHLDALAGLHRLADWIKRKKIHRAAVTNAPRASAEQIIRSVGLTDFFEYVVIGSECERPKPFPDPYLKGLQHFGVSAKNAFAFEVSRFLHIEIST